MPRAARIPRLVSRNAGNPGDHVITLTIGINGFGRIGRSVLTHLTESRRDEFRVTHINAPGPLETSAHLLRFDSVHGRFPGEVTVSANTMDVGFGPIKMFSSFEAGDLDWEDVDIVLECSGAYRNRAAAAQHLAHGAKRVLISAPAKGVDRTVVYGVNHRDLTGRDVIVSNASCTTNCLAPLAKVLNDTLGIDSGIMTTIHAYTGSQPVLDKMHSDLYRARAAALSMIPTSTGAAKAVALVLPELKGKLIGSAVRVPTPNVSAVDLKFNALRDTSVNEVNDIVRAAAEGAFKGIIDYDPAPKVSIDFNHDPHSSNFAPAQTQISGARLVRVFSWYDNEWGFSNRMADTAAAIGRLIDG